MAKQLALTRRAQYLAVYKSGKAFADKFIVAKILPNSLETARVGYSVTREIGKATVRNRVKRLLRENIRLLNVKGGWDIVIIARHGIVEADFHELTESAVRLLGRAHILVNDAENIGS